MDVELIDHVALGCRDPDATAARLLEEHGFDSMWDVEIPSLGWAVRLVPMNEAQYLGLVGVSPTADLTMPTIGWLKQRVESGDRFLLWYLPADSLDAEARRLGTEPTPFTQVDPTGRRWDWDLVGVTEALEEPTLPAYVAWREPEAFRRRLLDLCAAAHHRVRPTGIAWIEVSGDEARLRERLGPHTVPVRFVDGPPEIRAVGIATEGGEAVATVRQ